MGKGHRLNSGTEDTRSALSSPLRPGVVCVCLCVSVGGVSGGSVLAKSGAPTEEAVVRSEPGLGARTPGPLKALCGAQPGEVTLLLDPLLPHVKYENGRSYELYLLGFLNGQADGKHSDFPTLIL